MRVTLAVGDRHRSSSKTQGLGLGLNLEPGLGPGLAGFWLERPAGEPVHGGAAWRAA